MDLIENIITEKNVQEMSDSCIKCLGTLVDDQLGALLIQYLESPDADPATRERVDKLIGDQIRASVFHFKVLDMKLPDLVRGFSLDTLSSSPELWDTYIESFTWLAENMSHLRSTIPKRESVNFKQFISSLPKDRELHQLIRANQSLFYVPYEKERYTRISVIVSRAKDIKMAIDACRYLQYTSAKHLSMASRRTF